MTPLPKESGPHAIPPADDMRAPILAQRSTPRIPSLDGLRAVSIFLVLALHSLQRYNVAHYVPLVFYAIFDGATGVLIFFVISGYLITTLLLNEQQRRGTISLRGFYFRRAMRILPPLYVYVAVLLLLGLAGRLAISKLDIVSALFFFHDYAGSFMWSLEHFWSLSIEEQFYLIWPFVLLACFRRGAQHGLRRARYVALAVVCLSPVTRVASFWHNPHIPHLLRDNAGFHVHADSLMYGCLIALYQGTPAFERIYRVATRWWWVPVASIFASNLIYTRLSNNWQLPFGYSICGASAAIFLLWCVRNPESAVGRLLNNRPVMHIGVLSYSIYLWQTLFLHDSNGVVFGASRPYIGSFPGNWVAVFAVASLSFYLVERPSLHLRNRVIQSLHLYTTRRQRTHQAQ